MIIQYKFTIKGDLHFQDGLMFEFRGRSYRFEMDDKKIAYLIVRVKGDLTKDVSTVSTVDGKDGEKVHHFTINSGREFPFIQMEIKNLEGILSLYGIEEIDTHAPEIKWIAETPDEEKQISLKQFKRSQTKNEMKEPFPPDLMARAIMAASDAHELEVPLTFYRKATVSFRQGRYLEAWYDYFFFFESLFADSKIKKVEVQKQFRESLELQEAIKAVLRDNELMNGLARISLARAKEFHVKPINEISDFLVDFRGEIHHYKARHKKRWHPSKPGEAEFEATLFQYIAWHVAMKLALEEMYNEKINPANIKCYAKVTQNPEGASVLPTPAAG